jgi:folate-dependent phosphoribosylglycinamide formyltransferase PurN
MKIVILTSEEMLYLLPYLKSVLSRLLEAGHQIQKIYYCNKEPGKKNSLRKKVLYYIRFFGWKASLRIAIFYFWRHCQSLAVFPFRKSMGFAWTMKTLSRAMGIETEKVENINRKGHAQEIARLKPDIILSLAYPKLVKERILRLAQNISLNVHSALLPRFAGVNSPFWQMLHGEQTGGITVHEMSPEIDAGRIVYQEKLDLTGLVSLNAFYRLITHRGPDIVLKAISIVSENKPFVRLTDPEEKGTYFSFPEKKDRREFKKKGGRFF